MSRRRSARWVGNASPPAGTVSRDELRVLRDLAKEHWKRSHKASLSGTDRKPPNLRSDAVVKRSSPTAFADWIFWQLNPTHRPTARGDSSQKMKWSGEYGHEQIERLRLWLQRDRRVGMHFERPGAWCPIYVDSPDRPEQRNFIASRLTVNGQSLKGRPDVVLQNEVTKAVIILERKVTQGNPERIPQSGYANHLCQLWCYGCMDAWNEAPYVMLVLQYWHRDWKKSTWANVYHVAPVRLNLDERFHSWALNWFTRYGGVCQITNKK